MQDAIQEAYTNIKIIFVPPNTISKVQPLDLGIIRNFKMHYRKPFLRFVISKVDECNTASEVTKSVNVLQAIRWVAQAWKAIKDETISGVLDESFFPFFYDNLCKCNGCIIAQLLI